MISRYEYDSMIVVLYGVVVFSGLGVVIYLALLGLVLMSVDFRQGL